MDDLLTEILEVSCTRSAAEASPTCFGSWRPLHLPPAPGPPASSMLPPAPGPLSPGPLSQHAPHLPKASRQIQTQARKLPHVMFNILLLEDCYSFSYPCLMSKCQITISIPTTLAWSKSGRVCSIDICDASKHLLWSFVGTGAGWTAFSPFSTLYLSNLTDKLAHLEQEEMQILRFGLALWF